MITSEVREVAHTVGAAQTDFVFPFQILDQDELAVRVTDFDGGNSQLQTYGTDYTIDGIGANFGVVSFAVAPTEGKRVVLSRELDFIQPTGLINQGNYYAANHEAAFDRFVKLAQQLRDWLVRSISYPVGGTADTPHDAGSRRISNVASPQLATDACTLGDIETVVVQYLGGGTAVPMLSWTGVGNGSDDRFSITGASSSSSMLYLVTLSGVIQTPETDYTIDTDTWEVVFDEPPEDGADILVREIGYGKGFTTPTIYEVPAAPPAASVSNRGQSCLISETGQPDILKMSMRNADGSYSWTVVATASW